MIYLKEFVFPNEDEEFPFFFKMRKTCYDTFYPFKVLSARGLSQITFEPITVLYGGNGSGKSTALNIIAEKSKIKRDSIYNKSNFYPNYLDLCQMHPDEPLPEKSRIITSDDVFDYMLHVRSINEGIDEKREEIFEDYLSAKYARFQCRSIADYERLKKVNKARRTTQSQFVKDELTHNIREFSNGESAFKYFTEKIEEDGLYILDEPENSLSPKLQIELTRFIEDSARFFGCQFIISTHSPFLLAMREVKIYDLDSNPATVKAWTELENIRIYYDFFKSHESRLAKGL